MYARVYILDTRSGDTVWEGSLEDPGRSSTSDGQTWQVTAIGPSGHAKDETFAYIPIKSRRCSRSRSSAGPLSSATVGIGQDAADDDIVKVQFAPGGIGVHPPAVTCRP
jgi:hypothetical protein